MQHTPYDGTAVPELGHHHGTCNMEHTAYDGTATPELSPPMDLQHTKLLMTEQQHCNTFTIRGPATWKTLLMTEEH